MSLSQMGNCAIPFSAAASLNVISFLHTIASYIAGATIFRLRNFLKALRNFFSRHVKITEFAKKLKKSRVSAHGKKICKDNGNLLR